MIYIIEATGAGLVKIGFTESGVRKRLLALQTGCPHPLKVIATFHGNIEKERSLHKRFGHLRRNGEWFEYGQEIVRYLWLRKLVRLERSVQEAHRRINDMANQLSAVSRVLVGTVGVEMCAKCHGIEPGPFDDDCGECGGRGYHHVRPCAANDKK